MGADLESFDPRAARVVLRLLDLQARYHRLEVRGLERIPDGPALIVGNHSGGAAPVDALFLPRYYDRFGLHEPLHVLAHEFFFKLPSVSRLLAKVGIIAANPESARRALKQGRRVLVFPGSDLDSMRPFRDRKKVILARHQGFARLALATRVPVVPLATAGAHEGFVILAQGKSVMQALGGVRALRWHSFPVALCVPYGIAVGPICYLPYVPLPAKIVVEAGAPIAPDRFDDLPESARISALYTATEEGLQAMMDALYASRRFPVVG